MNKTKFGDVFFFEVLKLYFISFSILFIGGTTRETQLTKHLQEDVEREGIFEKKENKQSFDSHNLKLEIESFFFVFE